MRNRKMFLQLFEDGNGAGSGGQSGNAGNGGSGQNGNAGATYSYQQAEEIANARANKAERAALANYFRSQGMTEEQITTAINDFKAKQKESQPNVTKLEGERDSYKTKYEELQNEKILTTKGVKPDDLDYVMFKVNKMVDDKTDFTKAADKFLKDNPKYTGQTYRVSTGTQTKGNDSGGNDNNFINAAIRKAAGR